MFNLKEKATRLASKAGRKIVKHAPEIMFGAGCVAFVGTIYLAVKATPKINKVLEEHNKEVFKGFFSIRSLLAELLNIPQRLFFR